MRIEGDPKPLYRSDPVQAPTTEAASAVSFRSILAEFFAPLSAPFALQTSLHLNLSSGSLDSQTPELIAKEFHQELKEDTQQEQEADQAEFREDEILEDLEENQELMEDLVDQWEDAGERIGEKKDNREKVEESEDLSDIIEDNDDIIEGEKPLEDLLEKENQNKQRRDDLFELEIQKKLLSGHSDSGQTVSERDLTYEEIQMLVETTVNSKDRLPHTVRRILNQVLESLMQGRPYLLQVSNMMGLDKEDWYNLLGLFPGQFYDGLLRQYKRSARSLPLYSLLQEAFLQIAPTQRRQQQWEQILRLSFPDWPLLVHNWLQNQPLLFRAEDQSLKHILEIWKQQGSLPPGATGRALELALAHQHHPESMHRLFVISQSLLHGQELTADQQDFYLEKVYERCFHSQFSDTQSIRDLLQRALQGQDFDEKELSQIVQGCPQQVLSFLPYSQLSSGLQNLIDYIQLDLFGNEEAVPQLLLEEGVN